MADNQQTALANSASPYENSEFPSFQKVVAAFNETVKESRKTLDAYTLNDDSLKNQYEKLKTTLDQTPRNNFLIESSLKQFRDELTNFEVTLRVRQNKDGKLDLTTTTVDEKQKKLITDLENFYNDVHIGNETVEAWNGGIALFYRLRNELIPGYKDPKGMKELKKREGEINDTLKDLEIKKQAADAAKKSEIEGQEKKVQAALVTIQNSIEAAKKAKNYFNNIIKDGKINTDQAKAVLDEIKAKQAKIEQKFRDSGINTTNFPNDERTWYTSENPEKLMDFALNTLHMTDMSVRVKKDDLLKVFIRKAILGGSEKDSGHHTFINLTFAEKVPKKYDILNSLRKPSADNSDPYGLKQLTIEACQHKNTDVKQLLAEIVVEDKALVNEWIRVCSSVPALRKELISLLSSKWNVVSDSLAEKISNENVCRLIAPYPFIPEKEQDLSHTFLIALTEKKIKTSSSKQTPSFSLMKSPLLYVRRFICALSGEELKHLSLFSDTQLDALLADEAVRNHLLTNIKHCPDNVVKRIQLQKRDEVDHMVKAPDKLKLMPLANVKSVKDLDDATLTILLDNREDKEIKTWFDQTLNSDPESQAKVCFTRGDLFFQGNDKVHIRESFKKWFETLPPNAKVTVLSQIYKKDSKDFGTFFEIREKILKQSNTEEVQNWHKLAAQAIAMTYDTSGLANEYIYPCNDLESHIKNMTSKSDPKIGQREKFFYSLLDTQQKKEDFFNVLSKNSEKCANFIRSYDNQQATSEIIKILSNDPAKLLSVLKDWEPSKEFLNNKLTDETLTTIIDSLSIEYNNAQNDPGKRAAIRETLFHWTQHIEAKELDSYFKDTKTSALKKGLKAEKFLKEMMNKKRDAKFTDVEAKVDFIKSYPEKTDTVKSALELVMNEKTINKEKLTPLIHYLLEQRNIIGKNPFVVFRNQHAANSKALVIINNIALSHLADGLNHKDTTIQANALEQCKNNGLMHEVFIYEWGKNLGINHIPLSLLIENMTDKEISKCCKKIEEKEEFMGLLIGLTLNPQKSTEEQLKLAKKIDSAIKKADNTSKRIFNQFLQAKNNEKISSLTDLVNKLNPKPQESKSKEPEENKEGVGTQLMNWMKKPFKRLKQEQQDSDNSVSNIRDFNTQMSRRPLIEEETDSSNHPNPSPT